MLVAVLVGGGRRRPRWHRSYCSFHCPFFVMFKTLLLHGLLVGGGVGVTSPRVGKTLNRSDVVLLHRYCQPGQL